MNRRALAGLVALLGLAGCAFSSAAPLFDAREAQEPIPDGAVYLWSEQPAGSDFLVRFTHVGQIYELTSLADPADDPMRGLLFIPVPETPEEDFIVQAQLKPDETAAVYAFMWRVGEGWRVLAAPPAEAAQSGLCKPKQMGECAFARPADVRAYYRDRVYGPHVAGMAEPEDYIDLTPSGAAETGTR
jgi:hypothetical protein